MKNVKTKLTVLVKDGKDFPALQEIKKYVDEPEAVLGQVYKD